jgi:hypothetical protein
MQFAVPTGRGQQLSLARGPLDSGGPTGRFEGHLQNLAMVRPPLPGSMECPTMQVQHI